MSDSNSKNNNLQGFWKFTNGYKGICMSGGKFIKPWQVMDNIIEWIFMQFTFNILWLTLTQKIITCRVLKISHMDVREFVWGEGKFLQPWQVTDKIIG